MVERSFKISAMRSADEREIVIITKTMENIIKLIIICVAYEKRAISDPVVKPCAALFPLATISFAPNHEIKIIQV